MLFEWFAEHRRKKIIEEPFPAEWQEVLNNNVAVYALLTEDEQQRLRGDLRILIAEKSWEGCAGLELTDAMKVTIAAQAALLTINRKHNYYPNVESILVYPNDYRARNKQQDASGVVQNAITGRLGEAWTNSGPVILSWFDAVRGGSNPADGRNVVYHEFAHKLDSGDNEMNGVPLLDSDEQVTEWAEVMQAEYDHLVAAVAHGHETLLDPYGATNPAEFFAVATECFFEKPVQMRNRHPRMYHVLQRYYQQDTAKRHPEPVILPETTNEAPSF